MLEPVSCGLERTCLSYKAAGDQYIQQSEVKQRHGESAGEEAQDAMARLSVHSKYGPEHRQALERLFSSLKTLTAKEDMLQTLR